MDKEIAVFVNESGKTASMYEDGSVKVFSKVDDNWKVNREVTFFLDASNGIKEVRKNVIDLVKFLDKCKIFIGKEVSGQLYNVLDMNGVSICENEGVSEEFLDYLIEEEEKYKEMGSLKNHEEDVLPYPISENEDGNYSINLKLLSINKPNVTSKQALIPFLNNEKFYQLEVICGHVPRWFEIELDKLNLKYEVIKESETQYKVIIYHKTCNEK